MTEIIIFPLSWIVLFVSSICSVVLFVLLCVCWQSSRNRNQSYVMDSGEVNQSELPTNSVPHIIADGKDRYFLHGVAYSAINNTDECSANLNRETTNDHFSYNILSIFKNIQKHKFSNDTSDMAKMLSDNLEDSHTELMHKNFDKSILCLINENVDKSSGRSNDRDETYSCISSDSKGTFKSAKPHYNRSHSAAETFKSVDSLEN